MPVDVAAAIRPGIIVCECFHAIPFFWCFVRRHSYSVSSFRLRRISSHFFPIQFVNSFIHISGIVRSRENKFGLFAIRTFLSVFC